MLRKLLNAAKGYSLYDWAFLKIALVSAGILLGLYLYPVLVCYKTIIWVVFVFSYLWTIYRTFKLLKR